MKHECCRCVPRGTNFTINHLAVWAEFTVAGKLEVRSAGLAPAPKPSRIRFGLPRRPAAQPNSEIVLAIMSHQRRRRGLHAANQLAADETLLRRERASKSAHLKIPLNRAMKKASRNVSFATLGCLLHSGCNSISIMV